jgi:hypothetical protein
MRPLGLRPPVLRPFGAAITVLTGGVGGAAHGAGSEGFSTDDRTPGTCEASGRNDATGRRDCRRRDHGKSLHRADARPGSRPILGWPVRWRPAAAAAERGPRPSRRPAFVSGSAFVPTAAVVPASAFLPGPACATSDASGDPADHARAGAVARARPERGSAAASRRRRSRSAASFSGAAAAGDSRRCRARPATWSAGPTGAPR